MLEIPVTDIVDMYNTYINQLKEQSIWD
jgi:hypothetical protein